MSGEKDFLDDFTDDESAGIVEPVQTEVEPAASGRQRGPDGKFIKAEAERQAIEAEKGAKQAADEAAGTEPPSDDEEGQTVPLSALKALRKELQELKRSQGTSAQTQKPQAPTFAGPSVDFEEDPRSYLQQTLHAQKMQMSQFMAARETDEQTVQSAWQAFDEACKQDPAVSAYSYTLLNHPHPMGELVKWYQREQELQMLREAGGLEALIQQRMAGGQVPQAAQSRQPANVPPSLAGTGKPRSSQSVNDVDDGFDALFKR